MIYHQVLMLYDVFSNEKYNPMRWGPPNEFVPLPLTKDEVKFKKDDESTQERKNDQSDNRHRSTGTVRKAGPK